MTSLRWGTDAPNDAESARERLIEAAEACFERYGVVKTTVEDVAATARVSRATVYRYFADRDELILVVLQRDAGRFLDRLTAVIAGQPDLASALVDGVLYTIDAVQTDNNLALLFVPEAVGITTAVAGASEVLFGLTAELLRPFFETARAAGELRAGVDLDDAAEWVQRTVLSLLTFPGPVQRSPEEQRRFLRTFLVPALVTRHRPEATAPALPRERAERS